jgi:O-antigen/teichoic acid export membrane protein
LAFSDLGRLLHVGVLVTADRVLQFLLVNADIAVTGRMLGPERLGIYSIAVSVSTLPLEKVLPPTVQVSFAALSRMQAEPERLRRNVLRGVRLVSLLLCPAFLGLAAVAPDMVPLLLGAKWQAAVVPIQLLCLVLPLRAIAGLFQPALFAIGRPGLNAANTAATLVIMTAAFLIGVRHGVTGVAIAWVAAYPIAFAIVSTSATRALSLTVGQLLKAAAPPTLASTLMALGVVGLRSLLAGQLAPAVGLAVLILAGAAAYAAILWILDRDAVTELWRTLHG